MTNRRQTDNNQEILPCECTLQEVDFKKELWIGLIDGGNVLAEKSYIFPSTRFKFLISGFEF